MDELVFKIEHKYRPYTDELNQTENSRVYKAQDLVLCKDVCIKEIHIPGVNKWEIERNLEMVRSEARTMVRVSEKTRLVPSIHLTYYDSAKRTFYIVMDWVVGKTLDNFIGDTPERVCESEFLKWIDELCEILNIMGRMNISHKDVKPKNIIIDSSRRLHLLDFGISVSLPNKIDGTPHYKAPEMETSRTVKRDKVDVFSVGVIMYEYFAKKLPIKGSEYAQTSVRNNNQDWDVFVAPNTYNPHIDDRISFLIKMCMQKDPIKRLEIGRLKQEIKSLRRVRNFNADKIERRRT